jgi:hypothetical protein
MCSFIPAYRAIVQTAKYVTAPLPRRLCSNYCQARLTPRGPKGEKRPADVIGNAVHVMKVLTGEIEDTIPDNGKDLAAKALGKKGGAARARA